VLAALGLPRAAVGETVRVGWGRYSTAADVAAGFERLAAAVAALQKTG
jgi:cysteine sulfinate desulfinase/cysteine desulfurase-like protein